MQKVPRCRLIVDEAPRSGEMNMALDAMLLARAAERFVTGTPAQPPAAVVRLYRWNTATVSLGYFQSEADVVAMPTLAGLPRVRRLTGGGTLVHEHEWTYSVVVCDWSELVAKPVDLYERIHSVVIDVLGRSGILLERRGTARLRATEPVLCFEREDENDLTLAGVKVLGSAQRRRRSALLQHGGLIWKHSGFAPQLPGISDLIGQEPSASLFQAVAGAIATEISAAVELDEFGPEELLGASSAPGVEL